MWWVNRMNLLIKTQTLAPTVVIVKGISSAVYLNQLIFLILLLYSLLLTLMEVLLTTHVYYF